MKKLLSLISTLVIGASLAVGVGSAAYNKGTYEAEAVTETTTSTHTMASGDKNSSFSLSPFTVTLSGTSWTWSSPQIRGSSGSIITVTGNNTVGEIKKITFGCSSAQYGVAGTCTTGYSVTTALNSTVTGSGASTVAITLTAAARLKTMSVTYTPKTTDPTIEITNTETKVAVGSTLTMTAKKTNADSANVVWSVSDDNYASIDSSTGVLTGLNFGSVVVTAKITVSDVDYTATKSINVVYAEPAIVDATIAEVIADTSGLGAKKFAVTAVIKGWGTNGTSTRSPYGNMLLTDGTNDLPVYGATGTTSKLAWDDESQIFKYTSYNNFNTLTATKDIQIGDRITMHVIRSDYNSQIQVSGIVVSYVANVLSSISAVCNNESFMQGDSISGANFTVTGNYTVASPSTITTGITVSPTILSEVGDSVPVTVSVGDISTTVYVKVIRNYVAFTEFNVQENLVTYVNYSSPLSYSYLPDNATEAITFTSNDTSVCTVDENGVVTGVGTGTTTITAVATDFTTKTVNVTVLGELPIIAFSDKLTLADTGVSNGATTYGDFDIVHSVSGNGYSGSCAGGNNSIQIRSKNGNSGLYNTTDSGNIKAISVVFEGHTSSERTVEIYGSNQPYSTVTDLFDATLQGDLLGSICVDDDSYSLTITGDYKYVGICSSDGAIYLSSVTYTYSGYFMNDNVVNFANTLLDNILCDETGNEAPLFETDTWWETMATSYSNLTYLEKCAIAQATASHPNQNLADFIELYDYLVNKYDFNDYLGRKTNNGSSSRITLFGSNSSTATSVIVLISLVGICGYALISKKRKEN